MTTTDEEMKWDATLIAPNVYIGGEGCTFDTAALGMYNISHILGP